MLTSGANHGTAADSKFGWDFRSDIVSDRDFWGSLPERIS